MDDSVLPSKLLSDLSSAAEIIRSHQFIQLYSHFDADGLTSAAICAKALLREGKEFCITIFPTLSEDQMQIIESNKNECILVTDLGASYIKRFDLLDCDVVVLDHHKGTEQAQRICYANPHLYGIDGGTAGCGASMSLLFAVTLNERNWDLADLAVAGIVGDKQHLKGLTGLNTYIFEEASKRGIVKSMQGSLIPLGNLSIELYMSTEPFIEGVSGNPDAVCKFLEEASIQPNTDYSSLSPEQSVRLSSLIALKLLKQGVTRAKIEEATRIRFYLPKWGTDAQTLASVIDSCGRDEMADIGIALAMGDGPALEEGKSINAEARKKVMDCILDFDPKTALHQMDNIQWFDSSDYGFTGILCSIVMDYLGNPEKPTVAVNCSEEKAKASTRTSSHILEDLGIHMSSIMKQGCAAAGGEGGGHDMAAGGSFESSRRDEFLETVNRLVGEQKEAKAKENAKSS